MRSRRVAATVGLVAAGMLLSGPVQAQSASLVSDPVEVLLTTRGALEEVFPGAVGVVERDWRPTAAQRGQLEERLGRRLYEPSYRFLLAFDGSDRLLGYALVTDERGKYRPITFMVGVTPDFRVHDTAVMVYRESRGGEVQRTRFLAQYRGKTSRDPIRLNRDIINISGATISVRAMNAGVRKALAVAELAFGSGAEPVPSANVARPLATLR